MASAELNLDALQEQMYEQGKLIIDQAIADATEAMLKRITELQNLAGAMLASFTFTSSGYACRVGQVQIAKWTRILNGEQP